MKCLIVTTMLALIGCSKPIPTLMSSGVQQSLITPTISITIPTLTAKYLSGMVKDGRIKEYIDKEVIVQGNLVKADVSQLTQTDKKLVLYLIASESKVQKEEVCEAFFATDTEFNTIFRKWMLQIKDNQPVRIKGKLYISNVTGNASIIDSELLEY